MEPQHRPQPQQLLVAFSAAQPYSVPSMSSRGHCFNRLLVCLPCNNAGLPKAMGSVAVVDQTGNLLWSDCLVLDYDETGSHFLVQLATAPGSSFPAKPAARGAQGELLQRRSSCSPTPASTTESIPAAAEGSKAHTSDTAATRWVPRVQLCFAAEDPALYAKRFAASIAAMAAAEVQMAFELCIDCMPTDNVPQMTTEQVNR
jgi:dynein heavy chain